MPGIKELDVVKILTSVSGTSENGVQVSFPAGTEATVIEGGRPPMLEIFWTTAKGGGDALLFSLPEDALDLSWQYTQTA